MKQFNHLKVQQLIEGCQTPGGDGFNGGMSANTLNQIIEISKDCNCGACIQLLPSMYMALMMFNSRQVAQASGYVNLFVSRMGPAYAVEMLNNAQKKKIN